MQIARRAKSEQALQPYLPRRRRQQIGATHDVGDALQFIVDHDGQLVCDEAVRTFDDKVSDVAVEPLLLRALQPVFVSDRGAADGNPQCARGATRGSAVSARTRIDVFSTLTHGRSREFLASAGAVVDLSRATEDRNGILVVTRALALPHNRTIPYEAVRFECCKDGIRSAGTTSRLVDILDAQEPFAAITPRVAIARNSGNERTEMKRAGWRRREASAISGRDRLRRIQRRFARIGARGCYLIVFTPTCVLALCAASARTGVHDQ